MKRALVTGADGLLGSHLVRALLDDGVAVKAFVLPNGVYPTLDGLDLELVTGDLTRDDGGIADAVKGCGTVFHLAAVTDLFADRKLLHAVNVEGTRRVMDACLEHGVTRLVFTGSASTFQFGSLGRPGDETGPFPESYRGIPYMDSKHDAMQLVRRYVEEKGLDTVIVAPTFLLGGLDYRPSSGELLKRLVSQNLRYCSPGGRNFVHARDAARAMVAAAKKGRTGETYILGGQNVSYFDFLYMLSDLAGIAKPALILPASWIRASGVVAEKIEDLFGLPAFLNTKTAMIASMGTYYSPKKAVRELGMEQTPIAEAMQDSLDCLRRYGHLN